MAGRIERVRNAANSPLPVAALLLAICLCAWHGVDARVLDVEIERRVPIEAGRSFGAAGPYELIEGRVHFGFDPDSDANARVCDIELAPRGEDGLVHAWAELMVLQPIEPDRRRGTALIDVPNRGRRLALSSLNRADLRFDPPGPSRVAGGRSDWGDGFLMELALTVIWVGWQADAPDFPGAMRLRVPRARAPDGSPIRGLARSDWVLDDAAATLPLASTGHLPYRTADPGAGALSRRMTREGERQAIARERWRFTEDRAAISMDGGFSPAIYELVYPAEDPLLVGLGFAAFRDIAAFAAHDDGAPFPVERSVAIGSSQSGRFLRHLLYEGFNRDEAGRQVYQGVIVNIAGAGRGGFNHRFSQPGRVGNPFQNFFYPGDDFPFASAPQRDGERREGLLDRTAAADALPRIFQINTGYEYWGRAASLIHMAPDASRDAAPHASERLYHIASAPHYPLPFPPQPETELSPGVYRGSAVDTSYAARALLLHMLRWVEEDRPPPATRVPRLDEQTLVRAEELVYPVPGLETPPAPHVAYRLDFGPRFARGIIDHQPPQRGAAYGLRVPAIDALGNERSGIRLLEVRAPIATYTPWAQRTGHAFASGEMSPYLGTFIPLSRDPEERAVRSDPRPSLAELYATRRAYEKRVDEGIETLVNEGFLLARDRARAREAALRRWQWVHRSVPES